MTVGAEQQEPPRPNKKWRMAVLGLAATFVALACYDLTTMSGHHGANGVAAVADPASAPVKATGSGPGARPSPTAPATPARVRPAAPAERSLGVASIAAFGPDGLSDGDNPGIAARVTDVSTDQPWYSLWYATPAFGSLQSGTGLLLDMGASVTVSRVQLVLGAEPGADLQVRVGYGPDPADLTTAASAADAGGTVRLAVRPAARGRYVLIWFTRLPLASPGHYQASVYSVDVDGTG